MSEPMLTGLMMDDYPLSLTTVVERAEQLTGDRKVVSRRPDGSIHRTTMGQCAARARRLASALAELGIGEGDRVGTLLWNQPEHLELYYGVPAMGAVDPHAQSAPASRRARVHRRRRRGPRDRRRRVAAAGIRGVPLRARVRARDRRLARRRRPRRRDRLRVADRGGGADGLAGAARAPGGRHLLHVGHDRPAQGRPLLAPGARPALDGRGAAGRDERLDAGHRPAGRPDVPRQRLGDPLHRQHGRGGAGAARAAAGCRERAGPPGGRARDADRGRADGVDGDAEGDRGRARAVGSELAESPAGRRLGRPQEHDRGLPAARPVHRPGLGDDRDLAARQHRDRAPGARRRLARGDQFEYRARRARRPRSSTSARAATMAS